MEYNLFRPEFDLDKLEFSPDRIFYLAGHGYHQVNIPEEQKRYPLKDNEFYVSSIKCGYNVLVNRKTEKHLKQFITSFPHVPVPTKEMPSYYTLENLGSLLKTRQSRYNDNSYYIKKLHKIYVPFSEKIATNTVPNEMISLLAKEKLSFNLLEGIENNTPKIKDFVFENVNYTINNDEYEIWYMHISGIINAGNRESNAIAKMEALKPKSNKLIQSLGFKSGCPKQSCFHDALIVVVPIAKIIDDDFLNTDYSDDPLVEYFRDAFIAVLADSILLQGQSLDLSLNFTLRDIINNNYSISDIFQVINDVSGERNDEPVLLINDLCRSPNFRNIHKYFENHNLNNINRSLLENEAFSENEANVKSYKRHNARNRQTKKRSRFTNRKSRTRRNIY